MISIKVLAPIRTSVTSMNAVPVETTIDVTLLPPRQKHPTIFQAWTDLPDGSALVLNNDHDPLPLYYQFACEHAGRFRWEYLATGPALWAVRISKGDFPDPGFVPSTARTAPLSSKPLPSLAPSIVDTRPIFERGDTPCQEIDEAVASLSPGQALVLIVPFEPVPLYAKLGREGFTHRSEQLPDGAWRVEFKR